MMTTQELLLLADRRLGGCARYRLTYENELMQIPDEMRKCVVFVACRRGGTPELVGTAFQVMIGTEQPGEPMFAYVVTAKHVVRRIEAESKDHKVLLRVNPTNGAADYVETDVSQWFCHPDDESIDAAVLPLRLPLYADVLAIPAEKMAVTDDVVKENGVYPGDEVFITGLLVNHYGTHRNLPIVRTGSIALMPEEKVHTPAFGPIDAYLIESRSTGGLSGSPVFLFMGAARLSEKHGGLVAFEGPSIFYWLGLIHGHYEDFGHEANGNDTFEAQGVNRGIAIVVPAEKVLEVINQKELADMRKKKIDEERAKMAPTMDAAKPQFSKQDFDSALRKVSKRKKRQ